MEIFCRNSYDLALARYDAAEARGDSRREAFRVIRLEEPDDLLPGERGIDDDDPCRSVAVERPNRIGEHFPTEGQHSIPPRQNLRLVRGATGRTLLASSVFIGGKREGMILVDRNFLPLPEHARRF